MISAPALCTTVTYDMHQGAVFYGSLVCTHNHALLTAGLYAVCDMDALRSTHTGRSCRLYAFVQVINSVLVQAAAV